MYILLYIPFSLSPCEPNSYTQFPTPTATLPSATSIESKRGAEAHVGADRGLPISRKHEESKSRYLQRIRIVRAIA